MLVGVVTGSSNSGSLHLKDSSGTVLITSCDRYLCDSDDGERGGGGGGGDDLLTQMGHILVIDDFSIVVEQTLLPSNQSHDRTCLFLYYLVAHKWRAVSDTSDRETGIPNVPGNASSACGTDSLFFVVLCKNSLMKIFSPLTGTQWYVEIEVLAGKNSDELATAVADHRAVLPQSSALSKSYKCVLQLSDNAVLWYSLIQYGVLYCLTSLHAGDAALTPNAYSIDINRQHFIKPMESSPRWQAIPSLLDVADHISMALLPSFTTVSSSNSYTQSLYKTTPCWLVSFTVECMISVCLFNKIAA